MIPAMMNFREAWQRLRAGASSVRLRWVAAIVVVLLLQACSNSKFLVSVFYNRMDDKMLDATYEVASFNSQQKAALAEMIGTFHVWHRQSELPRYVSLMAEVSQSVADADFSADGIQQWMDEAEQYSVEARKCLPINFSIDLMKTLSSVQIAEIEDYFAKEREEDVERAASRTPEERTQRRLRNFIKWAGRIDIDVTAEQRAILLSAYNRQISLRDEYNELSYQWQADFLELIKSSANPDFEEKMAVHISQLWGLLESNYPEQWQANRTVWKESTLRFAESMSTEQRRTLSRWLNGMGSTLTAVSKDKPSFKVDGNPAVGCLV